MTLCPVRSALVLGDSLIGSDFDGRGGLGQAINTTLRTQWPAIEIDTYGVAGSNVGNWLHLAGASGPQIRAGVMARATRNSGLSINPAFLAEQSHDLVWINLASNDASILAPDRFADYAIKLMRIFVGAKAIVWTEGNLIPGDSLQRKKDALMASLGDKFASKNIKKSKHFPARSINDGAAYVRHASRRIPMGSKLHPPVSVHRAWMGAAWPDIRVHISRRCAVRLLGPLAAMAGGAAGWMILKK